MEQGRLTLRQGLAEIELFDGTDLILEGPTHVNLLTTNSVSIEQGVLLATVPHRAAGFSVATPVSQIVDLGTQVGVQVDAQGSTHTRVFKGRVEVTSHDRSAQPKILRQGEAV